MNLAYKTRKHTAAYKAWGEYLDEYKDYYYDNAWHKENADTIYNDNKKKITVPIIILTGHGSASAAEDFLIFMDYLKRGIKVGQRTFGSTGQPLYFDLPGGGKGRVCTLISYYPDWREYVGYGVKPDIEINPTIESYLENRDIVLEKGIEVLKQKINRK